MPKFYYVLFQQSPFLLEVSVERSFADKSRAFAILKRGRSNGKPNLRCRDLLASTAKHKLQPSEIKVWSIIEFRILNLTLLRSIQTRYKVA